MPLRTFMPRMWPSYLPWLALCMVLVLLVVYVMSLCGPHEAFAPKDARDTPPEDAPLPTCLTTKMLTKYETAANDMLKVLKVTMMVSDEFAKKNAENTDATTQGAEDVKENEVEAQDATTGQSSVGGGMSSSMPVDTQGGMQTDTTPEMGDTSSFSTPSMSGIETFAATDDSPCVVKPKSIEYAHKQLKERPLALLEAYNQLRERVNKGIDGLQRMKEMKKEQEVVEEERGAQREAILQGSQKEGDELNSHYDLGDNNSPSPF